MKSKKIRLSQLDNKELVLAELIKFVKNSESIPKLNRHCSICQYQNRCKKIMIKKDDLSLLNSISTNQLKKLKSRGISTITQLSYTFKPRRKRHITKNRGRYLSELKALSIREKQTHILTKSILLDTKNQIYLDFEGDLQHNIYLIGVVVYENKKVSNYSFWANTKEEEQAIFLLLIKLLNAFPSYSIYHYGSYEMKAIEKMNKRYKILDQTNLLRVCLKF